jgi:glycosyltransferase involved in cell wall biosynthesis
MADLSLTVFLPSLSAGGAERSIVTLANGLATQGVPLTLALAKAEGPFAADVNPTVRVIDLNATSVWRALPGLVRHLRTSQPSVLLSAISHANVIAALAHRVARSRARLVLSERAHVSSVQAAFPGMRMRATLALMRLTYPWADKIVTVSDGVAEDLRQRMRLPADRLVTIYNPVVDERLLALSRATPLHPWLSGKSVPVVIAAGRLIAQKDFGMLLEAFATVRRARPVRLIILGEGEDRASLAAHAKRLGVSADVSLPGFDPNPYASMRVARVLVLSSRFEGLPGVLIQAMACGTPVISTECPSGPREILEGGRWGALVPVGDAPAMAAAISAALDEKSPPDVRSRATYFSAASAVARYAEILGLVPER